MRGPRGGSLVPILLVAWPAAAQRLGQAGDDGVSAWRVFGALLLCLALALVGTLWLRQRMRLGAVRLLRREDRRLQLLESVRLTPQSSLYLVRCDGREMLVATGPHGVAFAPVTPLGDVAESR